jgi:hypothetical protein
VEVLGTASHREVEGLIRTRDEPVGADADVHDDLAHAAPSLGDDSEPPLTHHRKSEPPLAARDRHPASIVSIVFSFHYFVKLLTLMY